MPVVADIKIEGMAELEARLLELDALAGRKLLRRAVRRSLIPLHKAAKANAESIAKSGALAQAIKIGNVTAQGLEAVAAEVGPKRKDKRALALRNIFYRRRDKGIYYGHIVEFGFQAGRTKVRGRAWFSSAWNATRTGIVPQFERILRLGLQRIERRKRTPAPDTEGLVDP